MSGKKRAFTLVEILVSILILGIVMSAVLTIFYSVFESYQFHQDINEAKQRGQIALAAIEPYVINAGLGMPNTKSSFQKAFNGLTALLPATENLKFEIPVQIARNGVVPTTDKIKGDEVWLVFSVPSGAGINYKYSFTDGEKKSISDATDSIVNIADLDLVTTENRTTFKGWLTFSASLAPFWVTTFNKSTKLLEVQTDLRQVVNAFDEVHYVRAVKIRTDDDGNLTINRLDGTGEQPVIEGVAGLWCTFDPQGDRVLTISVLARGETRHTKQYQTVYEGWPADAPQPQGLDRNYRYAVVSRSWRIRN